MSGNDFGSGILQNFTIFSRLNKKTFLNVSLTDVLVTGSRQIREEEAFGARAIRPRSLLPSHLDGILVSEVDKHSISWEKYAVIRI